MRTSDASWAASRRSPRRGAVYAAGQRPCWPRTTTPPRCSRRRPSAPSCPRTPTPTRSPGGEAAHRAVHRHPRRPAGASLRRPALLVHHQLGRRRQGHRPRSSVCRAEAEQRIKGADLVPKFTDGPSATVPVGDVISRDPSKDTEVTSGSTVNLVVSTGAEAGRRARCEQHRPGRRGRAAHRSRTGREDHPAGDRGRRSRDRHRPEPCGASPRSPRLDRRAGHPRPRSARSPCPAGLVSSPLAQAQAAIQAAGLRFANATPGARRLLVPEGSVISTRPHPSGTSVSKNSVVNIVVDRPRAGEGPDRRRSEDEATFTIKATGLQVQVTPQSVPAGDVKRGVSSRRTRRAASPWTRGRR